MKRSAFALIALALVATVVCADQWRDIDVEKLIESAPDKEDYPDAAAVFLTIQEVAEVADDGSIVTTRNCLTKILTLRGRELYSNHTAYYNADLEELTLVKGVTVRKSGRVVEVEEDGINDITPAFLDGATIYANVLQKVISFPVAGPGSTMELQLREERTPATDGSFSGIEYMGGEDPILEAEFTLRYPKDWNEPKSVGLRGALDPLEIRKTARRGEVTYRVENAPALVVEEHMPPSAELLPRIMYSSYANWDQPAAFFASEFFPHVATEGDLAARAHELTTGLTSDEERIQAIFLDVATNVRNVYLNLGLGGYEPNDASVVLSNKYADTRDKAVLLVSMLRASGFYAYPAAVRGQRGTFVESVPTLRQFDRLLVAVPEADGYRFLDPFLDDVSYGFLRWGRGNTALVIKDDGTGELVAIPPFDPEENVARKVLSIVLRDDGSAKIRVICDLKGYFDRKARRGLKDATPSEEQKAFDAAANVASTGATDVEHLHSDLKDLTEPVSIRQTIRAPDFAVSQGDMMIVRAPSFPFGFATTGVYPTLAERKYPFDFPCEFTSTFEIKLMLPDGYDIVRIPEDFSIESEIGDLRLSCRWFPLKRALLWKQEIVLKEKTIPVERYDEFKDAYDALGSPKNGLVLLKKSDTSPAGLRVGAPRGSEPAVVGEESFGL